MAIKKVFRVQSFRNLCFSVLLRAPMNNVMSLLADFTWRFSLIIKQLDIALIPTDASLIVPFWAFSVRSTIKFYWLQFLQTRLDVRKANLVTDTNENLQRMQPETIHSSLRDLTGPKTSLVLTSLSQFSLSNQDNKSPRKIIIFLRIKPENLDKLSPSNPASSRLIRRQTKV